MNILARIISASRNFFGMVADCPDEESGAPECVVIAFRLRETSGAERRYVRR
jgi:hypothetical protein